MDATDTTPTTGTLTSRALPVTRIDGTHPARRQDDDTVIVERPLSIEADGSVYTMLRTPGADRDLVAGFLFTEGLIATVKDILMLAECPDSPDIFRVRTAGGASGRPRRTLLITSSCGLCGMPDIEAMMATLTPIESPIRVSAEALFRLPVAVRSVQPLFDATGGAHAAVLFDTNARIHCAREDVGRHNALDKLIGHALLRGLPMDNMGVFLSGRTSLEMIAKAARARIPVVAAVGAPTTAAVEAAQRLDITLCGFLRHERIVVYTHAWRIITD